MTIELCRAKANLLFEFSAAYGDNIASPGNMLHVLLCEHR